MRITNSQARKMVNKKLADLGKEPPADSLSYEDYAMQLRNMIELRASLNSRAEATGYIRWAAQHFNIGGAMPAPFPSRNALIGYEAGMHPLPRSVALAAAAIAFGLPPIDAARDEQEKLR